MRSCFFADSQISFLRLLTTSAAMGDEVQSQASAWSIYDEWVTHGGVSFLEEPASAESEFRRFAQSNSVTPKDWANSYLAAFAVASDLTLVTFDRGFRGKIKQLVVLKP
jgi:hypothetical protein